MYFVAMCYGLKHVDSTSQRQSEDIPQSVPSHIPQHHESGLTIQEHANVTTAVSELADSCCKRKKRGSYVA